MVKNAWNRSCRGLSGFHRECLFVSLYHSFMDVVVVIGFVVVAALVVGVVKYCSCC